jgi:hypothetical protein
MSGRRTRFTGPALVRLLARLAEADVAESRQSFAERLGRWLDWTHAIPLAAALDGAAARPPAAPGGAPPSRAGAEQREFERVRAALVKGIAEDAGPAAASRRTALPSTTGGGTAEAPADFAPYRRRYLARQQAMDAGIGALRGRLRGALAGSTPAMARLAAVDAVMEQVLGGRERALLATVPAWLEKRFERLRAAAPHGPDGTRAADGEPGEWLDVFTQDMRDVLLAELDVRLQPVEGLLDALRQQPTSPT